jgi:16S rRNA (guanine527-N7)-methyltransferase
VADERSALIDAAGSLGTLLTPGSATSLLKLIDELAKWNAAYNLTAITRRDEMITHHLLDSLSVRTALHGLTVADVGTGAGFPGLPLAIVEPERRFTLIDSNNKKVRFVGHAARTLALKNVTPVHSRAENFDGGANAGASSPAKAKAAANDKSAPRVPFDTVIARAFAALPELLRLVSPLCGPDTHVLAMKGKRPDDEIAGVLGDWKVLDVRPLVVPGLNEDRHLVTLQRA